MLYTTEQANNIRAVIEDRSLQALQEGFGGCGGRNGRGNNAPESDA